MNPNLKNCLHQKILSSKISYPLLTHFPSYLAYSLLDFVMIQKYHHIISFVIEFSIVQNQPNFY